MLLCSARSDHVLQAPTFKLIGTSLIYGSIELIGESMVLAEKSGVGAEHVRFQQIT